MELRESGITGRILIFGTLFPEEMAAAIKHDFRVTVTRDEDFTLWSSWRPVSARELIFM
jgi:hypothetical protein